MDIISGVIKRGWLRNSRPKRNNFMDKYCKWQIFQHATFDDTGRVYVGVWTIQWLGGSFQDSHCGMDVPHKNYKKTPFDHGTVHGTYRVYTGCRQVAGLPFSCVFFSLQRLGSTGGMEWWPPWTPCLVHPGCYIANRVELGGSVMYNVVKTQKKQCPSHHHFYTVGFYGYHQKPGWCIFVLHTHISHLHLSTRNDLRRLWRLKKHCRLWLGSLRQGGKFIGTVAGIPSLELEKPWKHLEETMDHPWAFDSCGFPGNLIHFFHDPGIKSTAPKHRHQVGLGPWPYHGHLCATSGVPARVCGCSGPDRWPSHWRLAMSLGKAELHGSTAFSPLKSQRYGMIWRITNKAQRRSRLKKGVNYHPIIQVPGIWPLPSDGHRGLADWGRYCALHGNLA